MNILGINLSHNASASLMIDGEITLTLQEERFTQKKNFFGYPKKSIAYILDYLRKKKLKIDKIGISSQFNTPFGFKYPVNHYYTIEDYKDYYGDGYYGKALKGKSVKEYYRKLENDKRNNQDLYLDYSIYKEKDFGNYKKFNEQQIQYIVKQTGVNREIIEFIDHHTCHAHYAYFGYISGFKKCAVLTLDSQGDYLNQTVWITKNDNKTLYKIASSKHCELARIYKLTTLILSMKPDEHEFKVMGLAPYAKNIYAEQVYEKVFKDILKVKNCKVIHKNRPPNLYDYLKKKLEPYRFDNIAGGLQIFLEKITKDLINQVSKKTRLNNFALSGGVSMNVKNNKMISEMSCVNSLFVPPSGADESLSIGACYYLQKKKSKPLRNIYLGFNISNEINFINIKNLFNKKKFEIKKVSNMKYVAKLLRDKEIVAVARGREEFGARALGNRSILANPSDLESVKKINEYIKNRDFWMPFALTILKEKHKTIIKNNKNIKCDHMTVCFDTNLKNLSLIKAGTHQYDNTVRPQILSKDSNEKYYDLINQFYKITGVPALLNTSLNLHGLPIASNLRHVAHTFKNSGIKFLLLDDKFLIKKKN